MVYKAYKSWYYHNNPICSQFWTFPHCWRNRLTKTNILEIVSLQSRACSWILGSQFLGYLLLHGQTIVYFRNKKQRIIPNSFRKCPNFIKSSPRSAPHFNLDLDCGGFVATAVKIHQNEEQSWLHNVSLFERTCFLPLRVPCAWKSYRTLHCIAVCFSRK